MAYGSSNSSSSFFGNSAHKQLRESSGLSEKQLKQFTQTLTSYTDVIKKQIQAEKKSGKKDELKKVLDLVETGSVGGRKVTNFKEFEKALDVVIDSLAKAQDQLETSLEKELKKIAPVLTPVLDQQEALVAQQASLLNASGEVKRGKKREYKALEKQLKALSDQEANIRSEASKIEDAINDVERKRIKANEESLELERKQANNLRRKQLTIWERMLEDLGKGTKNLLKVTVVKWSKDWFKTQKEMWKQSWVNTVAHLKGTRIGKGVATAASFVKGKAQSSVTYARDKTRDFIDALSKSPFGQRISRIGTALKGFGGKLKGGASKAAGVLLAGAAAGAIGVWIGKWLNEKFDLSKKLQPVVKMVMGFIEILNSAGSMLGKGVAKFIGFIQYDIPAFFGKIKDFFTVDIPLYFSKIVTWFKDFDVATFAKNTFITPIGNFLGSIITAFAEKFPKVAKWLGIKEPKPKEPKPKEPKPKEPKPKEPKPKPKAEAEKPAAPKPKPYDDGLDVLSNSALREWSPPVEIAKGNVGATTESSKRISKEDTTAARESVLVRQMDAAGIADPKERAMFMAQMSHESAGFRSMSENLNYSSVEKIRNAFGKNKGIASKTDEELQKLVRSPEALANVVYADSSRSRKAKLGNTEEGDGWKYRGRGFVQLTGKANYARAGKALGIDLVKNPDLVETDPEVAAKVAAWYWEDKKLGAKARAGDIAGVTKGIQGGSGGLDDRSEKFASNLASGKYSTSSSHMIATARSGLTPATTATPQSALVAQQTVQPASAASRLSQQTPSKPVGTDDLPMFVADSGLMVVTAVAAYT